HVQPGERSPTAGARGGRRGGPIEGGRLRPPPGFVERGEARGRRLRFLALCAGYFLDDSPGLAQQRLRLVVTSQRRQSGAERALANADAPVVGPHGVLSNA